MVLSVSACQHPRLLRPELDLRAMTCRPGLGLLFERPIPSLYAASAQTTVLDGAILTLNCQENP